MVAIWTKNKKLILLIATLLNIGGCLFFFYSEFKVVSVLVIGLIIQFLIVLAHSLIVITDEWIPNQITSNKAEIEKLAEINIELKTELLSEFKKNTDQLSHQLGDLLRQIQNETFETKNSLNQQNKELSNKINEVINLIKTAKIDTSNSLITLEQKFTNGIKDLENHNKELPKDLNLIRQSLKDCVNSIYETKSESIDSISLKVERIISELESNLKEQVNNIKLHIDNTTDKYHNRVSNKIEKGIENQNTIKSSIESKMQFHYEKLDSLLSIYNYLDITQPIPVMNGGRVSADLANQLLEIYIAKPGNVIDVGSGISTLLIAYTIKKLNVNYKVYSLENSEKYYQLSKNMIERHGLEDIIELYHAPLKEYVVRESNYEWYDIDNISFPKDVSLLFVDGPPGILQKRSRYPAIELLNKSISNETTIILDDGDRIDETEIAKQWADDLNFNLQKIESEKGFFILHK